MILFLPQKSNKKDFLSLETTAYETISTEESTSLDTTYETSLTDLMTDLSTTKENNITLEVTTSTVFGIDKSSFSSVELSTTDSIHLINTLLNNLITSTIETSVKNLSDIMAELTNAKFSMSTLSAATLSVLLNSKFDLSNCMINCSNHGSCKISSNNMFTCECDSNYAGKSCQSSAKMCNYVRCLNNATCVDKLDGFSCKCPSDIFYGTYCENEIDLCANETCSANGYCSVVKHEAKCECFTLYSGDHCEIETVKRKFIKAVVSIASVIAIICVITFYLIVITSDVLKFTVCREPTVSVRKRNKKLKRTKDKSKNRRSKSTNVQNQKAKVESKQSLVVHRLPTIIEHPTTSSQLTDVDV